MFTRATPPNQPKITAIGLSIKKSEAYVIISELYMRFYPFMYMTLPEG